MLIFFLLWSIKSISAYSKAQTEDQRVHMTSVLVKERNRIWKTVAFLVKQSSCSLFMKLRFYLCYLGKHLTEQELVTSGRQGHINQASSARTDELLLPLLCTSGKKLINKYLNYYCGLTQGKYSTQYLKTLFNNNKKKESHSNRITQTLERT